MIKILRFEQGFQTQDRYYKGGTLKSYTRGYVHKLMLALSPIWLYLTFPGFGWCRTFYYFLCAGSFLLMFISSVIYHHFEHSAANLAFWQKIDTCLVVLATLCNTVPSLIFHRLYFNLLVYIFLACATFVGVSFFDTRQF